MCGIFGIINLDNRPVSFDTLKEMGKSIVYRGPDSTGYHCEGRFGIGNNRLSIIDLEYGTQPIYNEDRSIAIVQNGEIYNYIGLKEMLAGKGHRFSTNCDTEVLVHLYEEFGTDMLGMLSGMFSFCILDLRQKRVFCARDRVGKKPFYYSLSDSQFSFASELKALLKNKEVPRTVSDVDIAKYFLYGYLPLDKTLFKEVKKLPPAHYIVLDIENRKNMIREYWDVNHNNSKVLTFEEYERHFEDIFYNSVKERMISDVPLGVFLSGGLDSSLVVAFMKKIVSDIKTFNIAFRENDIDESRYAKAVSSLFNTEHHSMTITDYDILNSLEDILNNIDDPIADPSIIPTYIVSRFARGFVKVALSGDGGDEVFGGYPKYYIHRYTGFYDRLPEVAKRGIRNLTNGILRSNKIRDLGPRVNRYLTSLPYLPQLRNQLWISPFLPNELKELLRQEYLNDSIFKESYEIAEKAGNNLDVMSMAMYMDIKLTLNDLFLVKVDRASMLNSLEIRNPFLDYRLIDFFSQMPSCMKVRGRETKYFLKRVAEKYIPRDVIYRKKQGFGIPLDRWLRGGLKKYVLEMLEEYRGYSNLNFMYIKRIVDDHMSLVCDNSYKIWALIVFNKVWKRYCE